MVLFQQRIVCQFSIKLFIPLILLFSIIGCGYYNFSEESLPYYNTQDLTPTWDSKNVHHITKFNLVDQTGRIFSSDSLKNKVYIANFFFTTCPSICPKMTKCFQVLQDSLSANNLVELISFSVMPWVDSVSKLKAYGLENKINPSKWHLLTGDKSIIYSLGRVSFFADNNKLKDTTTFIHTDKMYLVDRYQQIRGIYNATNMHDMGRVLADIQILGKTN